MFKTLITLIISCCVLTNLHAAGDTPQAPARSDQIRTATLLAQAILKNDQAALLALMPEKSTAGDAQKLRKEFLDRLQLTQLFARWELNFEQAVFLVQLFDNDMFSLPANVTLPGGKKFNLADSKWDIKYITDIVFCQAIDFTVQSGDMWYAMITPQRPGPDQSSQTAVVQALLKALAGEDADLFIQLIEPSIRADLIREAKSSKVMLEKCRQRFKDCYCDEIKAIIADPVKNREAIDKITQWLVTSDGAWKKYNGKWYINPGYF